MWRDTVMTPAGLLHALRLAAVQVAKLLVIPFVCMVEAVWFNRRFNTATLLSILTVIFGVATV